MQTSSAPCEESVTSAGLPHRAPLLDRERAWFRALSPRLLGRGRGAHAEPSLVTAEDLERGLTSADPSGPWIAAFLIGRCRSHVPAVDAELTAALERSIAGGSPEAILAVEVGMSLLLRGRRDRGLEVLHGVLTDPDPFGMQYKAAYYLAQAGDPAGYPQLHAAAHARSNQSRIMAIRHAIAFVPYNGQPVAGLVVDVRGLIVERMQDLEPIVRQEVPAYLEELGVPDLIDVLTPMANADPDQDVRTMAQSVIDRARLSPRP
jgi:hypothetical protein